MTTPILTMNAESAHTDATGAPSAVAGSTAEGLQIADLAKPCCDCVSRERCPVSHLMTVDTGSRSPTVLSRSHTLAHGEHLFRESDKAEALYVIKSGSAKVYFMSEDGSEQVVAFYMPGDVLGLDALGVEQHGSSALVLESTSVCVIPLAALEEACAKMSAGGWHRCLYKLLSRELIRDHQTMELITRKDAEAKMARFLIDLSERFRERGYSASCFNLSMKRSEIGSHLGLAVETVSRILTRFQDDGILSVERRRVQIFDHRTLEALAGRLQSH
jgi:CRP/FNR family transcriptional regulator